MCPFKSRMHLCKFLHKPSRDGARYLNMKKFQVKNYICDACVVGEIKEKLIGKKRKRIRETIK